MALIENKVEIDLGKAHNAIRDIQLEVLVDVIAFLRSKYVDFNVVNDLKRRFNLPESF